MRAELASTVAERIRARMQDLTAAERRLARALLAEYPILGLGPVSQFVASARVSPPTGLRFVAKLGFGSYPDFQRSLHQEIQVRISSPWNPYVLHPDAGRGLVAEGFEALGQNLVETARGLSEVEVEAVVALIADARRRLYSLGGRVSHVLSAYLIRQVHKLRPGTRLLPPGSPRLIDELVDLGRRDVVIEFDYRPYQQSTIAFARDAARRGVTVVLITDARMSPAADAARHVLTFDLESPSPFDSPIGAFAIVEVLLAGTARRLGNAGRERIRRIDQYNGASIWDDTNRCGDDVIHRPPRA